MKILVDTSVWSDALRRKNKTIHNKDTLLYELIVRNEQIALTGIILQEILSGITDKKLFQDIKSILVDFLIIEPELNDYIHAAEMRNSLKSKGITAGSIDFLIASIAINNGIPLATFDNDFVNIAQHSKLKMLNR
jgi:hypothetical protein